MWYSFPIKQKNIYTWEIFSWFNKVKIVWNTFNEDNWRYVWYWNKNFINPIWWFIIPKKYTKYVCIWKTQNWCDITLENSSTNIKNQKIFAKTVNYLINEYWIYNNINENVLQKQIMFANNMAQKIPSDKKALFLNKIKNKIINDWRNKLLNVFILKNANLLPPIYNTQKNKKIINNIINNWIKLKIISLPYKSIIPFNVTFNWSLQNLSSYYTDIWIIWLIILWITIIWLLFYIIYYIYIIFAFNDDNNEKIKTKKNEIKFFISIWLATLLSWTIWLFIADWIVWYNIWWLIWIIIAFITLLYLIQRNNKLISYSIIWSLSLFIFITLILNSVRIWSQRSSFIWLYKASQWKLWEVTINHWLLNYINKNDKIIKEKDLFNMQFPAFKRTLTLVNNKYSTWKIVVWWSYIKYFINNPKKVIEDNFLTELYKISYWTTPNLFYKRLKKLWIEYLYLSPNILSVIQNKWNV